jgi:hypothetical protein
VALCCVPGAPTPSDNSGSEVPVEFAQKPRFAIVADRINVHLTDFRPFVGLHPDETRLIYVTFFWDRRLAARAASGASTDNP